jgi:hypothetical protein
MSGGGRCSEGASGVGRGSTSRDRRAICPATESNPKKRRLPPNTRSTQEKTSGILVCVDVLKGTSTKVAAALAKSCRNSLARMRPGVRISSAPRVVNCKVSGMLLVKRCLRHRFRRWRRARRALCHTECWKYAPRVQILELPSVP